MHIKTTAKAALIGSAALLLTACGDSAKDEAAIAEEPALETPIAKLDAALQCTAFTHPDKPPVLLVHGTFTAGFEQYEWTYKPLLVASGYDVCYITYTDRGLGDMQNSAEYVVYALRKMHAETGRKVAMIGHSQGVAVPRWALKWWPSVREAVDDFVMQAGPNHGTQASALTSLPLVPGLVGVPEVLYQFGSDSQFMQATNAGDETPGDVSYTSLYTLYDELVQPVTPIPTAAIDLGLNNPKVANILLQDVCPGRIVDHATIGLFDRLTFELSLDAITHEGPASVERVIAAAGGEAALCGLLPLVPTFEIAPLPQLLTGIVTVLLQEPGNGLPSLHLATEEPPLRAYAQ